MQRNVGRRRQLRHSSWLCAGTLLVVQFILYHFVEIKRLQDYKKPGSQAEPGSFFGLEGAFKGPNENGYPGGIFDPLGLSKCGPLPAQPLQPNTADDTCDQQMTVADGD